MSINKITDLVKVGGKAIDDNVESGEERQAALTERLKIDMASDNTLSKLIRPVTLIFLAIMEAIIVIAAVNGTKIDIAITSQVGILFGSAVGFYFHSKRGERIADKNSRANLEMEKMRLKAQVKQDRRADRRAKKSS